MERANWHTYQVLTKRSSRLRNMLQTRLQFAAGLPHIWWGVSVEDRAHGLVRIKHLQQAPAAVRFLSIEPLLEDLGEVNLEGIHWVIVGGESGAGARPMREGMGAVASRPVRAGPGPVLLQTVGRRPQEQDRPRTRRQDIRRPPAASSRFRSLNNPNGWRRSPSSSDFASQPQAGTQR